jgi:hypothetical protein
MTPLELDKEYVQRLEREEAREERKRTMDTKLTDAQAELLARLKADATVYMAALERPEPEGFGVTAALPYSMPLYQCLNRIDRALREAGAK